MKKTRSKEEDEVQERMGEATAPDAADAMHTAPEGTEAGEAVRDTDTVVATETRLAELNDRHLRLAAEFENYKKRTAREWQERTRTANAELIFELLEIVDNFERALDTESADTAYSEGVRLIYEQLQAVLRRQGVAAIAVLGEPFDPARHDALLHVACAEHPEGVICQEIRRGYDLGGRVLRAAQVAVSRGAEPSDEAPEPDVPDDAGEADV